MITLNNIKNSIIEKSFLLGFIIISIHIIFLFYKKIFPNAYLFTNNFNEWYEGPVTLRTISYSLFTIYLCRKFITTKPLVNILKIINIITFLYTLFDYYYDFKLKHSLPYKSVIIFTILFYIIVIDLLINI